MAARLDAPRAQLFAEIALGHVVREYPSKLDHVLQAPEDAATPSALHPIFFGSYDWHSCVHGWWLLLRLKRLFPDNAASGWTAELADQMLVGDKAAAELAYFERAPATFERPYGWAWLLQLHGEAQRHDESWAEALAPLAAAISARFTDHLPRLSYPIRTGAHYNSAFAMLLGLDWAEAIEPDLAAMIRERALEYFADDAKCQAWEPGGDEFLSPALTEAHLMLRVLGAERLRRWLGDFLPELARGQPETLFTPATVSDRSDGKIAHLDGLNLSRAWSWRAIGRAVGGATGERAEAAADAHIAASLPQVGGDYMGSHWLASFALLALEGL